MTYVQSYEDVLDCVSSVVPAVWFSSADLTAAKEYIGYCSQWARALNIAAQDMGEEIIDEKKGVKAYTLEFQNGTKIHALSSNPSQFRSKGGKVVLDEYAFHDDDKALWAAARPCITWGFPLRILSTHNGKSCQYFKFVDKCKKGTLNWSLHSTDIFLAVKEGLADKITKRTLTDAERTQWVQEEHDNCGDENAWQQEYCCNPVDESTAFMTYDMIEGVEREDILLPLDEIVNPLYIGMDIARKGHLSVIWGLESFGGVKWTRFIKTMHNTKFALQREILYSYLEHPKFRRACLDSTGIGMQLSEEAQDKFGKFRVEQVTFTNTVKEDIAHSLYIAVEDKSILIPNQFEIRESFHSVRKITTAANNVRLDADEDKKSGSHADEFWAACLANHAVSEEKGPIRVTTRRSRKAKAMVDAF
jgi:phage FluMu gp28-like protein